ncbi:MAG TPA: ferredoxin-thioredoxin reductase catalytic domain-containing protein [Methanocella sp.]|nr:ferredoxin-thioredoxin reductase catalytic domain-containing protein [Methanocella sp.]
MGMADVKDEAIEALFRQLTRDAEQGGYRLNPDTAFTKALVRGLLVNKDRYGYMSCPCRLATGKQEDDLDIICPCDYRDPDLDEFEACYCALYVSDDIFKGRAKVQPVPERRIPRPEVASGGTQVAVASTAAAAATGFALKYPVWRCKVCGYLCARDEPPGICPVCKAGKERFERFI